MKDEAFPTKNAWVVFPMGKSKGYGISEPVGVCEQIGVAQTVIIPGDNCALRKDSHD